MHRCSGKRGKRFPARDDPFHSFSSDLFFLPRPCRSEAKKTRSIITAFAGGRTGLFSLDTGCRISQDQFFFPLQACQSFFRRRDEGYFFGFAHMQFPAGCGTTFFCSAYDAHRKKVVIFSMFKTANNAPRDAPLR